MYPQVRVRKTEDQVSEQVAAAYLLKVIESLSLEGAEPTKASRADQESKEKADPNRSGGITSPSSKVGPTPDPALKDKRNNIRASSVPPPRAVLSSPDNDGIVGHQNKRIQGRRIPVNGQEPENFGKDNQQRALTERSYTRTQANPSIIKAKRLPGNSNAIKLKAMRIPFNSSTQNQPRLPCNSNAVELKAKRIPFKSSMQNQPRTRICDAKTAKHSLSESSASYDSVSSVAGCHNAYPKIKCSPVAVAKSKSKVKKI